MTIIDYITYHIQPLLGLLIGIIIVLVSAYFHWKIDKKIKEEFSLPNTNHSISSPIFRIVSSFGIAFGGIMIIIAIKFLNS